MIGIRCKLPPAHAVRLEDFFRARYDKRRNVVASSTDPDEILEKRGIAQIATDADDATDGSENLSMWLISVTAFVHAAEALDPSVATSQAYSNPNLRIKQWLCDDNDVSLAASLLRPPLMADLRAAFLQVTKWDRVEGKMGIDRNIGVGVERLNVDDLMAIRDQIRTMQATILPRRATLTDKKRAQVTKARTVQVLRVSRAWHSASG